MLISEIKLTNFRIPGELMIALPLKSSDIFPAGDIGKKAFLTAMQRLFGNDAAEWRITENDFPTANVDVMQELNIAVKLTFPEFFSPDGGTSTPYTRMLFPKMCASGNGELFCVLRLDACKHSSAATAAGLIEQHLYWLLPENLRLPANQEELALFTPDFLSAACQEIIMAPVSDHGEYCNE